MAELVERARMYEYSLVAHVQTPPRSNSDQLKNIQGICPHICDGGLQTYPGHQGYKLGLTLKYGP